MLPNTLELLQRLCDPCLTEEEARGQSGIVFVGMADADDTELEPTFTISDDSPPSPTPTNQSETAT